MEKKGQQKVDYVYKWNAFIFNRFIHSVFTWATQYAIALVLLIPPKRTFLLFLILAIATTNRWKGVLLLFCLHCFCPTCYRVGEPLRDFYCYCFCFCYWVYSYCFASKAGNVLILFCPACYRVGEPLRDRVARLKIEITSSCDQQ